MKEELLASEQKQKGISFDPRTKLAVLITLAILVLGGSYQTEFSYLPALLPAVMMLISKKWSGFTSYTLVFALCYFLQGSALDHVSGIPGYLLMMIIVMPLYFLPTVAAGTYMITTTTVSEFIASMERMHMPSPLTISAAVMFRFFPTVMREWHAIGDAMKMRGIRLRGGKAGAMLEYRLVPMLMCSIKIGEELSAASLTRGLDGPVKRTNICRIGIHLQDVIILILCAVGLGIQICLWIGR